MAASTVSRFVLRIAALAVGSRAWLSAARGNVRAPIKPAITFWFLLPGLFTPTPGFCICVLVAMSGGAAAVAQEAQRQGEPGARIPDSIQTLAATAKQAFYERMEPPIPQLTLAQLSNANRDLFSSLRQYIEKSFDDAIDALAMEAANPGRSQSVEAALQRFTAVGQTRGADALFAVMAKRPAAPAATAAALRHSVALDELPAALAKLLGPPGEILPLPPRGDRALPAYQRAAALDPADAWTWIVLALLEKDRAASEAAIRNAEQAALSAGDWRAAAFANQLFGAIALEPRREFAQADRAYAQAVGLARAKSTIQPSDIAAKNELARDLVWLCFTQARRLAAAPARAACEEALSIRKAIAASRPDDARASIDLIASHLHLQALWQSQGLTQDAANAFRTASSLYDSVATKSGFVPIFNPFQSRLLLGVLLQVLVSASVLTLMIGLIVLAIYRHRITHLMRQSASVPPIAAAHAGGPELGPREAMPDIAVTTLRAAEASPGTARRAQPVRQSDAATWRAAWTYGIAGCAFAALASYLFFRISEVGFNTNRAAIIFLTWAWPTVLTLNLLWGRNRRRLIHLLLAYFGLLLLVCVRVSLAGTPPLTLYGVTIPAFVQPLLFWAQLVAPTLFLLLFLNRTVRAIGAVLFVLVICVTCGSIAGMAVGSMYNVTKAVVALTGTLGISSGRIAFWLAPLLGVAVFVPVGWFVIGRICRAYQSKRFSDQALIFDSLWLFQTLLLWEQLFLEIGHSAWIALGPFVLYKAVVWVGLRSPRRAAARLQPARLLLLRTFGFRRRSELLFDQLSARWRYAGPIQLIAAPDLAGRSIDPAKLLDFLSGRLRRRFVIEPPDLARRLAAFDIRPDPDARYRVNEVFCGDDAWREAVRHLMQSSDLVVMDLRGFTTKNQGCIFELQSLIDRVPVERIVLLLDATADVPFLRRTLDGCWRRMANDSPNRENAGAITLLDAGRSAARAVDALLLLADDALVRKSAA